MPTNPMIKWLPLKPQTQSLDQGLRRPSVQEKGFKTPKVPEVHNNCGLAVNRCRTQPVLQSKKFETGVQPMKSQSFPDACGLTERFKYD